MAEQHEIDYCGHKVRITCSLGVSDLASSGPALVADADRAMYEAKQVSRGSRGHVVRIGQWHAQPTWQQNGPACRRRFDPAGGPAGGSRSAMGENRPMVSAAER